VELMVILSPRRYKLQETAPRVEMASERLVKGLEEEPSGDELG